MYYIVKKDYSAILGATMWITRDDLAMGTCQVASFPSVEDAKSVFGLFPKKIKALLSIISHSTLADRWNIFITEDGMFRPIPSTITPEEISAIPKDHLARYTIKQSLYPSCASRKKAGTANDNPKPLKQVDAQGHPTIPEIGEGITDADSWTTRPEGRPLEKGTLYGNGIEFSSGPVAVAVYEAAAKVLEALEVLRTAATGAPILMARADKELQDELHFAELYDLSAKDGYEVYRRIKELRRKRREAKDALEVLSVASPILGVLSEEDLSKLSEWIKKKDERAYRLRSPATFIHSPH